MQRIVKVLPLPAAVVVLTLTSVPPSSARVWYVTQDGTGDATTIQEAIALTADFDTVLVAAGTYHDCTHPDTSGTLNCGMFSQKWLWLISEAGPEITIIDAGGAGRVLLVGRWGHIDIRGFTLTGGVADRGAGIMLDDVWGSEITDTVIMGNVATSEGGGIFFECIHDTYPLLVSDCVIMDNCATDGAGILVEWGYFELERSMVAGNTTYSGNGGAITSGFTYYEMWIRDTVIVNNLCPGIYVFYGLAGYERLNVTGVTLAGNENPQVRIDDWTPVFDRTICIGSLSCFNYGYPGWFRHCNFSDPPGSSCGTWTTPNLNADPLFCDPRGDDFTLAANSPCLPENNQWGVLVGALGEGCGPIARLQETWAKIKARYR
jgi:hypothetical protein